MFYENKIKNRFETHVLAGYRDTELRIEKNSNFEASRLEPVAKKDTSQ